MIVFGGKTMSKKEGGKKSGDEVSARNIMVLEQVCGEKNGVSFSALVRSLPKKYKVGENTLRKNVEELCLKIPIIEIKDGKVHTTPATLEKMWLGTSIGDRLIAPPGPKIALAKAVFSFVEQHKNQIGKLILGAGTTVHKCACELIKGASCLRNIRIHTANLLVFHEFIWHKPANLYVESPNGELYLDKATLWRGDIAEYFKGVEAQAVITSFSDMSFEKGFCTVHHDIEEKLANLKPNPETCKWVVIPIEWQKIARSANTPVAESRKEQVNCIEGKRKYIIITDRPPQEEWNPEIDDEKMADLAKWKEEYKNGIEIYSAPKLLPIF
jgi:DeoR/GlpR family transcriptional regulator of sugar metabolism